MAFYGANVEQLETLGRKLEHEAEKIRSSVSCITPQVTGVDWRGPDAEKFKNEWSSTHAPALKKAAEAIRIAGQRARKEAAQQRQASA